MKDITVSLQYLTIALLFIIKLSHQTNYTCNSTLPCGCSKNSAVVSRIVGGESASADTWGWAVSIYIGGVLCGGSIISNSSILTAAHCVNGVSASRITVYAGSLAQWSGTQTRSVSKVIVHPSYNSGTYVYDLAILRLSSALTMSDVSLSLICLPSISAADLEANEWPPVGTNLVAVGWGTTSYGGSSPGSLFQVTVQAVAYNASTCTPTMYDWTVQFCAGVTGGGKDTCQGDSGGPLMYFNGSNQWVLVGITSNGIECASANYSGTYTRVAAFQNWIKENMNDVATTTTTTTTTTRFILSLASNVAVSIINIYICVAFAYFAAFCH